MMAHESGSFRLIITIFCLIMLSDNKSATIAALLEAKNQTLNQEAVSNNQTSQSNQANSTYQSRPASNQVPQSQTLAFQLIIEDAPNDEKKNSNDSTTTTTKSPELADTSSRYSGYRPQPTPKYIPGASKGLKRPYDIQYSTVDNNLEMYNPTLLKNLYMMELENVKTMNRLEGTSKRKELPKRKIVMNQRSELMRTQHRPPWRWRDPPFKYSDDLSQPDIIGRRYKLRFTTASPTTLSSTTEFFKLISSAHSPVKYLNTPPASMQERTGSIITASKLYHHSPIHRTRTSRAPMITNYETTTAPSSTPYPASLASRFKLNPPDDRVLSPAIVVKDGDSQPSNASNDHELQDRRIDISDRDSVVRAGNLDTKFSSYSNYNDSDHGSNSGTTTSSPDRSKEINTNLQFDDDQELSPKFSPLTFFNGKKPVTIIRHSKPKLPPIILLPSRVRHPPPLPTNSPPQMVRLIAKQKHKYDDRVLSPTLTVVDNDFNRLPPNSTSVHNNKLIVAIRPGRPQRRHPTTTQFPVYNIVAGITPPYPNNPPVMSQTRPPSHEGSIYGLLKPSVGNSSIISHPTSSFGLPHIKFPAAEPTNLQPEHVDPLPDKFNITVPDSANNVKPNNVPDKIFIETDEQHSRPLDAVVQSDTHIVSRPYGPNSVSTQDGLMKIRTTRRPSRGSTTQRVSIVSANTTVVTTNPEQLHEVLSNVIDSHQQDHHHVYQNNNNNNNRPHIWTSVLNYLSNLINSGVATSAIAVLTLIKTIFVALLVMFLPPMALAAAILQVISIG